jgi:hypothetical protein
MNYEMAIWDSGAEVVAGLRETTIVRQQPNVFWDGEIERAAARIDSGGRRETNGQPVWGRASGLKTPISSSWPRWLQTAIERQGV